MPFGARIARFNGPTERQKQRFRGFEFIGEPFHSHKRLQPRTQLSRVHGLRKKIIRTRSQTGEAHIAFGRPAHQHDRNQTR